VIRTGTTVTGLLVQPMAGRRYPYLGCPGSVTMHVPAGEYPVHGRDGTFHVLQDGSRLVRVNGTQLDDARAEPGGDKHEETTDA